MINSELQAELRARFNPDGSELRKIQMRQLEILRYIDEVCKQNNIPYWLSSGTLLGAVRHGGFIPWDDDIDIEMLGDDYDRFLRIMEYQSNSRYTMQTHKTDPAYVLQFGKLRDLFSEIKERIIIDRDYRLKGVFVDIFPMEYSPWRRVAVLGEYLLRICMATNRINQHRMRYICRCCCYSISFNVIAPLVRFITQFRKTNCLRHRFGSMFHKERYIEDIFPLSHIEFEGCLLSVPGNYDAYLSRMFGNYMKLPELDSLNSHTANISFLD